MLPNSIIFHSFPLLKYIPFHSIHFHSLMITPFHSIPLPYELSNGALGISWALFFSFSLSLLVISLSLLTHLLSFPPPSDPSTTTTHCTATHLPPPPTAQPPFATDASHRRRRCRPPISPLGTAFVLPRCCFFCSCCNYFVYLIFVDLS